MIIVVYTGNTWSNWNVIGTGTSDLFGYLKMSKMNSTFNFTLEKYLNRKITISFSALTNLCKNQLSYGKIHWLLTK